MTRKLWTAALLCTLAALLTACGGNPRPQPTPTPTPAVEPTPTPTPVVLGPYLDGTTMTLAKMVPPAGWPADTAYPKPYFCDRVNNTMAALTGCGVKSDCVIEARPQDWMARVIQAIREQGYAAGQHEPGKTDEIAVALRYDPKSKSNPQQEGYHIYAGDGWDDPGAVGKVVWCMSPTALSGAYKGAWLPVVPQ